MNGLLETLERVSRQRTLSLPDKAAISPLLDEMATLLATRRNPEGFRLASGEIARGATGRVAANAYLLLLARKAFGTDYTGRDERFAYWNMHLGFHIMRGHFLGRFERGLYCCAICSLSVLPLYCTNAFKAFDCAALKKNVLSALEKRETPFSGTFSRRYAEWAMRFV